MKNSIQDYQNAAHSMFTHETIKVNDRIIKTVYRNKGYAGKSRVYGSIFQIFAGEDTLAFKTKDQVVRYLKSLN
jgi:hypothetical protein